MPYHLDVCVGHSNEFRVRSANGNAIECEVVSAKPNACVSGDHQGSITSWSYHDCKIY
jgi:hypothetical protein